MEYFGLRHKNNGTCTRHDARCRYKRLCTWFSERVELLSQIAVSCYSADKLTFTTQKPPSHKESALIAAKVRNFTRSCSDKIVCVIKCTTQSINKTEAHVVVWFSPSLVRGREVRRRRGRAIRRRRRRRRRAKAAFADDKAVDRLRRDALIVLAQLLHDVVLKQCPNDHKEDRHCNKPGGNARLISV